MRHPVIDIERDSCGIKVTIVEDKQELELSVSTRAGSSRSCSVPHFRRRDLERHAQHLSGRTIYRQAQGCRTGSLRSHLLQISQLCLHRRMPTQPAIIPATVSFGVHQHPRRLPVLTTLCQWSSLNAPFFRCCCAPEMSLLDGRS